MFVLYAAPGLNRTAASRVKLDCCNTTGKFEHNCCDRKTDIMSLTVAD